VRSKLADAIMDPFGLNATLVTRRVCMRRVSTSCAALRAPATIRDQLPANITQYFIAWCPRSSSDVMCAPYGILAPSGRKNGAGNRPSEPLDRPPAPCPSSRRPASLHGTPGSAIASALAALYACHPRPGNGYPSNNSRPSTSRPSAGRGARRRSRHPGRKPEPVSGYDCSPSAGCHASRPRDGAIHPSLRPPRDHPYS
jgi:hypothetical protein